MRRQTEANAKPGFAAFLFYVDDWLSSDEIELMDAFEERGYFRLLIRSWKEVDCGLPDNDMILAQLSKLGAKWNQETTEEHLRIPGMTSGQKLRNCFFVRDGRIYNSRLLKEREHQESVRAQRKIAGAKGGRPKNQELAEHDQNQLVSNSLANGKANGIANGNQNETSPKPISPNKEQNLKACASDDAREAAAPEKPLPDTGSEMAKPATAEFELQDKAEPPKKKQFPYNADTVFEHEFWPHRWRPEGKSDARNAFKRHAKGRADADRIIASVKEQFPHYGAIDDVSKRPHMSTWINGKRYEDNLAESGKLAAAAAKQQTPVKAWVDPFEHLEEAS